MVKGLNKFREFFKDFTDSYILIGGSACDEHLTEAGLSFRATKDLDIILVVEVINSNFVKRFWEFVKSGNYEIRQESKYERKYYRFLKPAEKEYPHQLELFARNPDLLDLAEKSHLTPIPTEDDLSSLSAILMNDSYYSFTIKNSNVKNNLHLASTEALICLKAKAFLDLTERKENGEIIDNRNIKKHKNDVIRLSLMLTEEKNISLPNSILADMKKFLKILESNPPDFQSIVNHMGIPNINGKNIIEQIKKTFSI